MPSELLIVGGGAFGLSAALELARRGHAVHLLEPSPGPAPRDEAASTDQSKAVRMDYGGDLFYTEFGEQALAAWPEFDRGHETPTFHREGWLLTTPRPMQPGEFEHDSYQLLRNRGHVLQRLTDGDLRRRLIAWSPEALVDGYLNPSDGWVDSTAVCLRLVAMAEAAGVVIERGVAVHELLLEGGQVVGVQRADGIHRRAATVIVCAGAWTPQLVPWLADRMQPVAQPLCYFEPSDPRPFWAERFPPWAADIGRAGWYGFPVADNGLVKVGHHGTGEHRSPDGPRVVSASMVERFRAFLATALPGLANAPLAATKVCFYCDTFDGNFWIDHDPQHPGLVVAAGGCGHAFKFTPLLGGIIADVVERRPNSRAHRFRWRDAGTRRRESARAREP
jgi:glycine/D-amino acid oxidase-like deaminating enzyme